MRNLSGYGSVAKIAALLVITYYASLKLQKGRKSKSNDLLVWFFGLYLVGALFCLHNLKKMKKELKGKTTMKVSSRIYEQYINVLLCAYVLFLYFSNSNNNSFML